MELFEEIVNGLPLITELKKSREKDVVYAINNMLHVRMGYSDNKGGKGKKERFIYPVAYGLTKRGNPAIRAFQTAGSTKRGKPKWKLFLFDNIFSWSNGKRSYTDYAENLKILGFNPNGDLGMTKIFAIAPIANRDVMVTDPEYVGVATPVDKTDVEPTSKLQNPKTNKNKNFVPAGTQRQNTVDTTGKTNYISNSDDVTSLQQNEPVATSTEPFMKQNIDNNVEKQDIALPNNAEPVTKQDVIGNTDNNNDIHSDNGEETNQKQNNVIDKMNDLTNRMNNLYKNEND